ncbi:MAG: alcohol dehydrogenase catalytic domain-containing protein [Thermoleophilia bacterium]
MRAVTTDGAGGLALATVSRPHPPLAGGLVRVRVCGLCGSDLEKLGPGDSLSMAAAGYGASAGIVLGHEVVGLLERAGEPPVRVALAHHVPCGECALCRAGHSSLCSQFVTSALDPGGFAEILAVSALHLQDAVFELPPTVDDLTGTLLEPLSCVLRALDTAAGLAGAFPGPGVRGGGGGAPAGRLPRREPAGEPPNVLVAGCGSVGLLFLSALARSATAGAEGDGGARLTTGPAEAGLPRGADGSPGAAAGAGAPNAVPALFAGARLFCLEPDSERAALGTALGAPPIYGAAGGGGTAPIDVAFVTAPAALPEVVAAMGRGGIVVMFAAGAAGSPAALDLDVVYRKEITLAGVRSGSPAHLRRALALLVEGCMPLEWFQPEVVGLEELPNAVRRYRRGGVLKVVVRP